MAFLTVNNFFSAFLKIPTRRTVQSHFSWGFFFKNQKMRFFGGPKQQFLKLKFQKKNFFVCSFKGKCHEIFDLIFFHKSNPSGHQRAKMVFLKNLFSRRYSNLKTNTAQSRIFLKSQPFKKCWLMLQWVIFIYF